MTPQELLHELANDLWDTASACVADAIAGNPLPQRCEPLRSFIVAQGATDSNTYHLPEPLLLASNVQEKPSVVVVGTNAGFGALEIMPTLVKGRDNYINFYATRFDQNGRTKNGKPATSDLRPKYNKHYGTVERVLVRAQMGERPLGTKAVYADAIPWKTRTTKGLPFHDPNIQAMALKRITRIVEALNPLLILIPVLNASRWLADQLGACDADHPDVRSSAVGQWEGAVIAMHHHARWPTAEHCRIVSDLIAAVLAKKSGDGIS